MVTSASTLLISLLGTVRQDADQLPAETSIYYLQTPRGHRTIFTGPLAKSSDLKAKELLHANDKIHAARGDKKWYFQ
jgi:hypothetical protein